MQNQRDSLDEARAAFSAGDYPKALERYEYFFDHALDDDKAALYGVRLSYCLNEWADLGEMYPEAKSRLNAKGEEAIAQFHLSHDPERFHDYVAICRYLKCDENPILQFVGIHNNYRSTSVQIVRFVWDQLVKQELWGICSEYLLEPMQNYEKCIWRFDQKMSFLKEDANFGGGDFEEHIGRTYIREVGNILLVLNRVGKKEKFEAILERVEVDLRLRDSLGLYSEIQKRIAI